MLSGLTSNSSSAELLIEAPSGREVTNYPYMTFESSEGLILLTGERLILFSSIITIQVYYNNQFIILGKER